MYFLVRLTSFYCQCSRVDDKAVSPASSRSVLRTEDRMDDVSDWYTVYSIALSSPRISTQDLSLFYLHGIDQILAGCN
jgi:hypothetical protein